jgi:TolB-like protein
MEGIRFTSALFALVYWVATNAGVARAQDYEAELKTTATSLVGKLEAANQQSGTVLDFTDLQGAPTELGRFLAQELSDQLVTMSKKISFVDRANLQTLLRENKLSMDGLVNPESSKRLGKLIGVDTIIFGNTTQIGDKIRLSIRAVAVETGKIVATQSSNLPVAGGLGDLQTRGVASAPTESTSSSSVDPRARFKEGSIKLTGKELVINTSFSNTGTATIMFENLSGVGFGGAVRHRSTSFGACVDEEYKTSGLPVVDESSLRQISSQENPEKALRYIPVSAKVTMSISMYNCRPELFSGQKTTDVAFSLVVALGKEVFVVPLTAFNVPVRAVK